MMIVIKYMYNMDRNIFTDSHRPDSVSDLSASNVNLYPDTVSDTVTPTLSGLKTLTGRRA